jgi:hypothetical protein
MIKYTLIDDAAISLGGTSLTLDAITEPFKDECEIISSADLCHTHLQFKHPQVWIIGNTLGLNKESYETLITILQTKRTVKIDFDYGFCKYRGPTPHRILGKKECDCITNPETLSLKNIYTLIHNNCSAVFYMSEQQRQIHKTFFPVSDERSQVLTSCFTSSSLKKMKELRESTKNGKYAIIQGHPGWHSQAKGVSEAVNYALQNNLDYDIISTKTHNEMLETLGAYKGLVFLPIIEDTCPRITIEAKLMGLEVLTNDNSQHTTENWWNSSLDDIESYLAERPQILHHEISNLS